MNIRISNYNKIILVGNGGSGKSYLSKRIAELTGHPLYHLDKEFWQPGWVMMSKEGRIARQHEILSGDKWIIDGDYGSTMETRFAAADLVIFMDINRITCIISATKRLKEKRTDMPDYLETPGIFSKNFLQFAWYIWNFPKSRRKNILTLRGKYPHVAFAHIKTRREGQAWILK